MGALVLKSGSYLNSGIDGISFKVFEQRVLADGGEIVDKADAVATLDFVGGLGIGANNIVTLASPRWAVKKNQDGVVTKIYSLLGEESDALITGHLDRADYLDVTNELGFNTVKAKGSHYKQMKSMPFEFDNSLVVASVNRPLQLSDNASYGDNYLTQLFINKVDVPTYHTLLHSYNRKNSTDLATWSALSAFEVARGSADKASVSNDPAEANKFSKSVIYLDDNKIALYKDGVSAQKTNMPSVHEPITGTMEVNYTVRGDNNSRPLYAHIAEVWALKNVSDTVAAELSNWLSQKYAGI